MIDSDAIDWDAPDWEHPARRAGQLSNAIVARGGPSILDPEGKGHRGTEEISKFWDANVGMIKKFHFHITDSFANGPSCANVARITTTLSDGATMTIDCILIYTVDDEGLIKSLRAHWEPDRSMATITKASS